MARAFEHYEALQLTIEVVVFESPKLPVFQAAMAKFSATSNYSAHSTPKISKPAATTGSLSSIASIIPMQHAVNTSSCSVTLRLASNDVANITKVSIKILLSQ